MSDEDLGRMELAGMNLRTLLRRACSVILTVVAVLLFIPYATEFFMHGVLWWLLS